MTVFRAVVIILLALAALPMPIGYYAIVRIAVTSYCVVEAIYAYEQRRTALTVAFIIVAILFNPIIKVGFPKEICAVIDLALAGFLFVKRNQLKP